MDITKLILHPELMDHETLYDLRNLLALHPYYQTVRLLLLKNLYLLHDSCFDEELRSAAIYITDRKVIFNLIEAVHYKITSEKKEEKTESTNSNRTISLIDDFLGSIPTDNNKTENRKPTPANAALDYVSYLLENESEEQKKNIMEITPQLKGQNLIDDFIFKEGGKITLKDAAVIEPSTIETPTDKDKEKKHDDEYFTETLAKIYIKQGRYFKAMEIIQQLNLNYPKKNAYFADQMRFLEKLILNNKNK